MSPSKKKKPHKTLSLIRPLPCLKLCNIFLQNEIKTKLLTTTHRDLCDWKSVYL